MCILSWHLLLRRYREESWLRLYKSLDRQQWANIHNSDEGLHDIFSQPKSDVSKVQHESPKPQVVWTYSFHDWKNPGLPLIVLVRANNKIHLVRMIIRLVLSSKTIVRVWRGLRDSGFGEKSAFGHDQDSCRRVVQRRNAEGGQRD